MPLRERIDSLRLKTGQPISEDWYDELAELLKDMSERGAVTYEGYVHRSLIPYKSKVIDLGTPAFQFDEAFIDKIHSTSIYSTYANVSYIQTIHAETEHIDVFGRLASNRIEAGSVEIYDGLNVEDLNVRDRLYVYGSSYLGDYVSGYKGSFYEIDVDFLHVYDSLDVPNYSIGFIKLDPYLISSPLRKITVQANSSILMDRGVWYVNLPSGVTVEVLFGNNWIPVLDSEAGLVISDGVNVRITNSNESDVEVQVVFIR